MQRDYKSLELDKILELLAEKAESSEGAELARALEPEKELARVEELLGETDAAFVLMARFGAPSFNGLHNVTSEARRAQAGGSLNMPELLKVAGTLRAVRSLSQWREKSAGQENALAWRFRALSPDKYLEERIFSIIISEEEVADNASPKLSDIRRKIRNASQRIRDKLDGIIRSQDKQKYLQDSIITQRSGRFVVPVKAEFKAGVPGIVHDSSASGATVFIEPMAVVEANNEIRELKAAEKEEIERILDELSEEVAGRADTISESFAIAVQLDLIFAKAKLAYDMKAARPKVNGAGTVNIKGGRHPLINKEKVVPSDIMLGTGFDALIITGPNTGGKTVALKTLGLMCLMAMCGLMLPAGDESEVAVFTHILCDIGDEQSIEQSLSTFSAHMTNIIRIMGEADRNSLVLLDELGAGTDPVEGAALAEAIIEELRQRGVKLACTTHYAELKSYALETHGVENGCCEFNVETLSPTYRLLIGIPGKSNAFAILRRLGMEDEVVSRAEGLVSHESSSFETVIGRLEEKRLAMEKEIEAARHAKNEALKKEKDAGEALDETKRRAEKEIEAARREAAGIVDKTRRQADALLNELDEAKRKKNKELSAQQRSAMRSGLRALESLADPVRRPRDENYKLPRKLKAGDSVLISDIEKEATVLEEPVEDSVLVQAGIIKTRVKLSNLRLLERGVTEKKRERTVLRTGVTKEVSQSLDLRGMNSEEAIMEVEAFLDRAARAGLSQLTIIHGKGTGVLRTAVQKYLRTLAIVKSFRDGAYGEGGIGVTIVEI